MTIPQRAFSVQKYLSNAGFGSRRAMEPFLERVININGKEATWNTVKDQDKVVIDDGRYHRVKLRRKMRVHLQ